MNPTHPARTRLRAVLRRPAPQLNLAEAALYIAWEDQGSGNPAAALRELDGLAEAARPHVPVLGPAHKAVAALNAFLFDEVGFRGNTWNYNDPANSFLDRVLETRTGLPITLSIVYMEVGWRLGLPLVGAALPGHFLARYLSADADICIDPFNCGRLWSRSECLAQISAFYGAGDAALVAQLLRPPSHRAILVRMLRNLKNLYLEQANLTAALAACERIVLLEPQLATNLRERGLLRAQLNLLNGALEDLERYAQMAPHADDLATIRQQAVALARRASAGN